MKPADWIRDDNGFLSSDLAKWTTRFRAEFALWINLYEEINRFGHAVLRNEVTPLTTAAVLARALYLRVVTSYQAALVLAERGLEAECKTILRGLAEAAFSLGAIEKDKEFASRLLKANQYEDLQWKKKWNELNRGQDERLAENIRVLSDSVSKRNKLSVREIADAAGMLNVYFAQYSGLCMYGHPTPYSAARRIRRDKQTNSIRSNVLPMAEEAHDNLRLGMMFMLFALKSMFNMFKFPHPERVVDLHDQFTELCATVNIIDLKTSQRITKGKLFIVTDSFPGVPPTD